MIMAAGVIDDIYAILALLVTSYSAYALCYCWVYRALMMTCGKTTE